MIELNIYFKDEVTPEEVPSILDQIKLGIVKSIQDEAEPDTIGAGGMITDDQTDKCLATYSVTIRKE